MPAGELDLLMIALSLIAVVYIGFVALVQQDMKKLIAYSSIAHMGFVTLGAFVVYQIVRNTGGLQGAGMGMDGAMVQMISHGLVSGALFLCVGVLYDRMHSRADRRLRRRDQHHADLRGLHGVVRAGQHRPAGHLGIRRRVPGDPGELQGELLVFAARGGHADPRRGVHAVAGEARGLRARRQRPRRGI